MEAIAFVAGLGVGLSLGLSVALRLMAARDPAPRVGLSPRPPRPDNKAIAVLSPREREEMTR